MELRVAVAEPDQFPITRNSSSTFSRLRLLWSVRCWRMCWHADSGLSCRGHSQIPAPMVSHILQTQEQTAAWRNWPEPRVVLRFSHLFPKQTAVRKFEREREWIRERERTSKFGKVCSSLCMFGWCSSYSPALRKPTATCISALL